MKKCSILSILLVLCLTLCLLAGCGKPETATSAEEAAASISEARTAETGQADAPDEAPTEAPAEESAAEPNDSTEVSEEAAPADDGTFTSPAGVVYPCGDGSYTITYFKGYNAVEYLASQNDYPILPLLLEATGVNFYFQEVSNSAESEQFQLMVASGDYTDLISGMSYTGGSGQAYLDEVIIDLTDRIPVYAPDYWDMCNTMLDEVSFEGMYTKTDSGEKLLLALSGLTDGTMATEGYACRGDWLEEMGYAVDDMATLDGFTQVLYDAYARYGCSYTWFLDHYTGTQAKMVNCPAFDTAYIDIGMRGSSLNLFLTDGMVESAWTSDGYRDYLEWFHQLYTDRIINNDFYQHSEWAMTEVNALIGTGETFCWLTGADWISDCFPYADENNADMVVVPIGQIVLEEGQENHWGTEGGMTGMGGGNISSTCEEPDLVLQYFNYFFTEPGILAAAYGTEGETYVINTEGIPEFTDMVLHNDMEINGEKYSLTPMRAINLYTATFVPTYTSAERSVAIYTEDGKAALDVWTIDYAGTDRNIPATCTLTTSEQESITNESSDVISYGQEMVLKFLTGIEDLTDESWSSYVENMKALGLDHCLEVWQTAWDNYNA